MSGRPIKRTLRESHPPGGAFVVIFGVLTGLPAWALTQALAVPGSIRLAASTQFAYRSRATEHRLPMLVSDQLEDAPQLLRAEYLETPTLCLTPGEVAELLGLDRPTALTVLQALEDSDFLELTPDGQFRLTHDRRATNQR